MLSIPFSREADFNFFHLKLASSLIYKYITKNYIIYIFSIPINIYVV